MYRKFSDLNFATSAVNALKFMVRGLYIRACKTAVSLLLQFLPPHLLFLTTTTIIITIIIILIFINQKIVSEKTCYYADPSLVFFLTLHLDCLTWHCGQELTADCRIQNFFSQILRSCQLKIPHTLIGFNVYYFFKQRSKIHCVKER